MTSVNAPVRNDRSPPAEVLDRIESACDEARFLDAYALTREFGSLEDWQEPHACLAAANLAHDLGAPRLGVRLVLRAYRRAPSLPRCQFAAAVLRLEARGPLDLWRHLQSRPVSETPDPKARWAALRAHLATQLGDYDAAREILATAEREVGRIDNVLLGQSYLLHKQDQYTEALDVARESLASKPHCTRSLQVTAELLALLDRPEEAVELLEKAQKTVQFAAISLQTAMLQLDLGRDRDALESLDRFETRAPLLEPAGVESLAHLRFTAHDKLGHVDAAIAEARKSKHPLYQKLADRLATGLTQRRKVLLNVRFVRQHHLGCVPAVLSILCRFWGKQAEHLQILDAICYDGTPAHAERRWAEENGFATRLFTVTWESATALLDRGLPFTLTTSAPGRGHLQAVIGYDDVRESFYLRDPFIHTTIEVIAEKLLADQRVSGPRGMALVPREAAERLAGIDLPDADKHDLLHAIDCALSEFDRTRAVSELQKLQQDAPSHPLTLLGERAIAAYDQDMVALRANAEKTLALFPGDPVAELNVIAAMRSDSNGKARIERLERLCSQDQIHFAFLVELAAELANDPRTRARARCLLRRVVRIDRDNARAIGMLAAIAWEDAKSDEAITLWRFASGLEPTHEELARAYFQAAWLRGRAQEAFGIIAARSARLGARSAMPFMTHINALEALDRRGEVFDVLERALTLRPSDGQLLLFAARLHIGVGKQKRARALLEMAKGKVPEADWLRAAVIVADAFDTPEVSLSRLHELLALEPLAVDAHHAVAMRLALLKGDSEARQYIQNTCIRFPHHRSLLRLRIQWLVDRDPSEREQAIRELLALDPEDASIHRELAMHLAVHRRMDEAREANRTAASIDPDSTDQWYTTAHIAYLDRDFPQAREACITTVKRAPDFTDAMVLLSDIAMKTRTFDTDMDFVRREILPQSVTGGAIAAFFDVLRGIRLPKEMMEVGADVRASHPHLAVVWMLSARTFADAGEMENAITMAQEATKRLPLLPAVWENLANTHMRSGDTEAEITALCRALILDPNRTSATVDLIDAQERAGRYPEAANILERGLKRAPYDIALLSLRAQQLHNQGKVDGALEVLERIVALAPSNELAWDNLFNFSRGIGRAGTCLERALKVVTLRPWDKEALARVARMEAGLGDYDAALETIQQALVIDPRGIKLHDMHAAILAEVERYPSARKACRPTSIPGDVPVELQIREALVIARSGKRAQAVKRLFTIMAEWPHRLDGWEALAWLCPEHGTDAQIAEIAKNLARLTPENGRGEFLAGQVYLARKQKKRAIRAYRRALARSPHDQIIARALVDLLLEAGELEEAEGLILRFRARFPADWKAQEAILALKSKIDAPKALKHATETSIDVDEDALRAACLDPEISRAALAELARSFGAERAYRVLDKMMSHPERNPMVGAVWLDIRMRELGLAVSTRVLENLTVARSYAALAMYFAILSEKGGFLETLWSFIGMNHALQEDDRAWSEAGWALLTANLGILAEYWLRDYHRRSRLTPAMLDIVATMLRSRNRHGAALEVSRRAITLRPDRMTPGHHAWILFEEVLEGNLENANAVFGQKEHPLFKGAQCNPLARQAFLYAQHMWEVQKAPDAKRAAVFAARSSLAKNKNNERLGGALDEALEHTRRRANRRMAKDAGFRDTFLSSPHGRIAFGTAMFFAMVMAKFPGVQAAVGTLGFAALLVFFRWFLRPEPYSEERRTVDW